MSKDNIGLDSREGILILSGSHAVFELDVLRPVSKTSRAAQCRVKRECVASGYIISRGWTVVLGKSQAYRPTFDR